MKLGILGTSEIAFRRFLPALKKCASFEFAGVASRDISKTKKFTSGFGGTGYDNYDSLLNDVSIDCVYIPLPPALHYDWAKKALLKGKHILLEKPFTDTLSKTKDLINIAQQNQLAVCENYMFTCHSQIDFILNEIKNNTIGKIRLYRIDFGFPFRGASDFRYNKELGGGALLDCGGYTLKLASILLGESAKIIYSLSQYKTGFDIDISGNASLVNDCGDSAQIAFGMDNSYKCSLEAWGSNGVIYTNRIFTAPDNYSPVVNITVDGSQTPITLPADDSFKKSIEYFYSCLTKPATKENNNKNIILQAKLVEEFVINRHSAGVGK
jgi:predicted dehydrogenase